jgi:hypothetical protein
MITLIPIEPLNEQHGALIVAAFGHLLIDGGGQPDGRGNGRGYGYGDGGGNGGGNGDGRGNGRGYGGNGDGGTIPDEWRVDESNGDPADGQNQEMLDERKR